MGIGGAITAKKLLEPFIINITADSAAVLDKTVSSGVSVCQEIATSLSQAAQSLYGLSDAANNLCFAMQGNGGGNKPAATSIGRRGNPLDCLNSNSSKIINERKFSGHALDRMQERGITPSVVENVIKNGTLNSGNTPDTTVYIFENVKVILNASGGVITVIPQ